MHSSPLFTALRLLRVGTHLLHGALQVGVLFPFAGRTRRQWLKRRWSRRLLQLLKLRVVGNPAQLAAIDGGLLVANHISFIDIFVINAMLPAGFVAKSEVARWPLVGWLCRHNETVFIERGSRLAAHRAQQTLHAALRDGGRLALFPEGTSSGGQQVLPFHGALLQSAIDAAAPVYALALSYHHADGRRATAPAYIDDISLLECLWAVLGANGLIVRLELAASFMPPLPERRHLAHHAHRAVAAAVAAATCP